MPGRTPITPLSSTSPTSATGRKHEDPFAYDLSPVSNINQSLFSSTRSMFKILKPLDSSGPLPALSSTASSRAQDMWPQHDAQAVKIEDLPDVTAGCRVLDEYNAARNTARLLAGSDDPDDKAKVAAAQHLLAKKPTVSFASMMALALLDTKAKRLTVSEIYKWIKAMFPYFASQEAGTGWKNSVRHNLSLNSHFKRVGRQTGPADKTATIGKGSYWTLKSVSLPHLEERFLTAADASESARHFMSAVGHAKHIIESFSQSQPAALSPSRINTETPRTRRRASKSRAARQRDVRELDAIAHTLLSLKSANAKGFKSKPLPSIKQHGRTNTASSSSSSATAQHRAASAVITGTYDPHARMSTASSGRTPAEETGFVFMQSPDATVAAVRRSRAQSGVSTTNRMESRGSDEAGLAQHKFTFTSPMSLGSHGRGQPASLAPARNTGDELLERMDTATDDELSATAALLSLAGMGTQPQFSPRDLDP